MSAVLLVTAAGLVWVRRDVTDSDRFARHVREALVSGAVRRLVVEEVTDRVVDTLPIGGPALREPVAQGIDTVITSAVFADAFEGAVANVHRAFIEGDQHRAILDLTGAESLVRDAVNQVDPRLGGAMPSGVLSQVDVDDRLDFPDFHGLDEAVERGLRWSLLGAVVAGGLALLVTRERHRVLVVGGLGTTLGGVALILGAMALPGLAAWRVSDGLTHDAVRSVATEMVEGLRIEGAGIAALGLAMAVAGVAIGRRIPHARVV